jgi:hypothetical protein
MEIWEDHMTMLVLNGNQLPPKCEEGEKSKVSMCIQQYYWAMRTWCLKV